MNIINCRAFTSIQFPFLLLAPAYGENKWSVLLRQFRVFFWLFCEKKCILGKSHLLFYSFDKWDVSFEGYNLSLQSVHDIVNSIIFCGNYLAWLVEFSAVVFLIKMQFCLKLSLLASLPASYGGLDGRVIYIDVESKFSSRRYLTTSLRHHSFEVYVSSLQFFNKKINNFKSRNLLLSGW